MWCVGQSVKQKRERDKLYRFLYISLPFGRCTFSAMPLVVCERVSFSCVRWLARLFLSVSVCVLLLRSWLCSFCCRWPVRPNSAERERDLPSPASRSPLCAFSRSPSRNLFSSPSVRRTHCVSSLCVCVRHTRQVGRTCLSVSVSCAPFARW